MDHFGAELQIKSVDQRIISGWAAYHSNVDRVADIIEPGASQKAVARLSDPSTVGVLIGHDMSRLPVGVPIKIEARAEGLYTEVKVFDGPTGDDLLGAARGLKAAGRSLGLSIGYRVRDARPDRVNGKSIRRLLDYDLIEFSYASQQAIANDKALVVGIKTGGSMTYTVKPMGDKFAVMKDGESLASYDTEDAAQARCDALNKPDGGKTLPNSLPDSAFLHIAPGGVLDDEGKTVPRTNRHFRFRGADGALDAEALAVTLTEIPQAKTVIPDDRERERLTAHVRRLLAADVKTVDAAEWRSDTVLDMLGVAYSLIDAVGALTEQHKALAVVGQTTNDGRRMPSTMREQIEQASKTLAVIAEQALLVEQGKDEEALADWWQAQFSLLEAVS